MVLAQAEIRGGGIPALTEKGREEGGGEAEESFSENSGEGERGCVVLCARNLHSSEEACALPTDLRVEKTLGTGWDERGGAGGEKGGIIEVLIPKRACRS